MLDLSTIPADRLALLKTATLYHGSHDGTGGPGCKHCARELLHEVVTGRHDDATPPGCTVLMSILPVLNDGPWRDDAHRTEVMRPYLMKMLLLDPSKDEQRIYAVIDHVYRSVLPDVCDALKLDKHGSALRDMVPVRDMGAQRQGRARPDLRDLMEMIMINLQAFIASAFHNSLGERMKEIAADKRVIDNWERARQRTMSPAELAEVQARASWEALSDDLSRLQARREVADDNEQMAFEASCRTNEQHLVGPLKSMQPKLIAAVTEQRRICLDDIGWLISHLVALRAEFEAEVAA